MGILFLILETARAGWKDDLDSPIETAGEKRKEKKIEEEEEEDDMGGKAELRVQRN